MRRQELPLLARKAEAKRLPSVRDYFVDGQETAS